MLVFVLYDRKAETVRSLFTADNEVSAVRATVSAARNGQGDIGQYPGDFELRCIAGVDERLGTVIPADVVKVLGSVETLLSAAGVEAK